MRNQWALNQSAFNQILFREIESPNSSYFISSSLDYRNLIECAMRLVDMNTNNNFPHDQKKVGLMICFCLQNE